MTVLWVRAFLYHISLSGSLVRVGTIGPAFALYLENCHSFKFLPLSIRPLSRPFRTQAEAAVKTRLALRPYFLLQQCGGPAGLALFYSIGSEAPLLALYGSVAGKASERPVVRE